MKLYKHTNTKQAAKLSKRLNKDIEELVKGTDIYIPPIKTKEFFNFDPIGNIKIYQALYVINGLQLEQAQLSLRFDIVKALTEDIVKGETSYIDTENPSDSFIIQYLLNTDNRVKLKAGGATKDQHLLNTKNGVKLKEYFNIEQSKDILDKVDVDIFLAWAVENDYLVKVGATDEIDTHTKNKTRYRYPQNIEKQLFQLLKEHNFINDTKDDNGLYQWLKTNALLAYLGDKILDVLTDKPRYKFKAIEGYIKRPEIKTVLSKSLSQQPKPVNFKTINKIIERLK